MLDSDIYCCLGRRGPHHPHCGSLTAAADRDLHYLGPALLEPHIVQEEHIRTVADRFRERTSSGREELTRQSTDR
jgi:hypothetical protein